MRSILTKTRCVCLTVVIAVGWQALWGQNPLPRVIPFSGSVQDASGHSPSGRVGLTFTFYEEQQGGAPLWSETQTVSIDGQGHYSALLGSAHADGLPQELFTGNQARWVGVQPALPGVAEQARVMLVGVPYAMKASDAETLGGKPAAAYVTTDLLNAAVLQQAPAAAGLSSGADPHIDAAAAATTGNGKKGFIPIRTTSAAQGNSALFQSGTGATAHLGIGTTSPASTLDVNGGGTLRGDLILPPTKSATAAAGANSNPLDLEASSFNSASGLAINQDFRWQAEASGNDSASPSGTLNLLFGTGGVAPAETGLSINNNGTIQFAAGQTFPTVTGNETVTGGLTANQLTSTVATGTPPLAVTSTTQVPNLNASLLGGLPASSYVQYSTPGTVNSLNVAGSVAAGGTIAGATFSVPNSAPGILFSWGNLPFMHTAGDPTNVFIGQSAGNLNNAGPDNVALGSSALKALASGGYNTAVGAGALPNNLQGYGDTALGYYTGANDTAGTYNTYLGYGAGPIGSDLANATAVGANAMVGQSNSVVLGAGGAHVGIGTAYPAEPLTIQADDYGTLRGVPAQLQIQGSVDTRQQLILGYFTEPIFVGLGYGVIQATEENVANTPLMLNPLGGGVTVGTMAVVSPTLTVAQGQGNPIADGWSTYSSRRWKTNIRTLPDALDKVEHLRGVSYDLKSNGKHEIGVIAEEVGAVVPEVVNWEKNGKDAQGVDYSRLTALLIEAVKQQEREISELRAELRAQKSASQ